MRSPMGAARRGADALPIATRKLSAKSRKLVFYVKDPDQYALELLAAGAGHGTRRLHSSAA